MQAPLDAAPAVFEGHVEHWLRLRNCKVPPDASVGGHRQGEVEHEPGLTAFALAAKEKHALVQQAIDDRLGGRDGVGW